MISMAASSTQRDPITFTDDKFEVGVVIRSFLDAIQNSRIDDCANTLVVNSSMYVVDFARKWECQGVLDMMERIITSQLRGYATRVEVCDLLDLFLLATKLERYDLAGDCLRTELVTTRDDQGSVHLCDSSLSPNRQSEQPVEGLQTFGSIQGASVFDLGASCYLDFLQFQPSVVWALLRSNHHAKNNTNGKKFEQNLGDEFVKLRRVARKSLARSALMLDPLTFRDAPTASQKREGGEV